MAKLKSLSIQNFMSIRKAVVDFSNQGLVLIRGENLDDPAFDANGAGKSSIMEALVVSLYEKTIRGLTMNEVVNEDIGKNMVLFLDFDSDTGKEYRISRYRKHKEHKNNTYIFQDGVNITPKSTKDCNVLIEEIFGMDFMTFTNSILFGGGLIKTFSVATDAEKKSILEKMLKLDTWGKAQEVAKRKLKEVKEELATVDSKVEKSTNLVAEMEDTIKRLKEAEQEAKDRHKQEIEELKYDIKEAEKKAEDKIVELQEELDEAEKEHIKACANEVDSDTALEELEKLQKKVDKNLKKFDAVEDQISDLRVDFKSYNREYEDNDKKVQKLYNEIDELEDGIGKNCPVCGQPVTADKVDESIEHCRNQIAKLETTKEVLAKKSEETKESMEALEKLLKKKKKYMTQKEQLLGETSQIKASIKAEEKIRESLQKEVKRATKALEEAKEKPEVERLKKQLKRAKQELGGTKFTELVSEKEEQKKLLLEEIKVIKDSVKDKKERQRHLEFAVDAYGNSGIKSKLLDSVTAEINQKANYYLRKLAGTTIEIKVSTQTRLASGEVRDKFDVQIKNLVGSDNYKGNSTGERRRIDLSISLALQDLVMTRSNAKMNILLYDEVFDGLDAIGCENVVQLLQEIQGNIETIFVITHNDTLKAFFDKHLVVTKEQGKTSVTTEG